MANSIDSRASPLSLDRPFQGNIRLNGFYNISAKFEHSKGSPGKSLHP